MHGERKAKKGDAGVMMEVEVTPETKTAAHGDIS